MSKINISDIFQQVEELTSTSGKLGAICKTFIKQEGRNKISNTVKQIRSVCDTLENVLAEDVEKIKGEE